MAFCENCGERLAEGCVFCESCGAKVSTGPAEQKITLENFEEELKNRSSCLSLFRGNDWEQNWKRTVSMTRGKKVGIILTRGRALLNELSGGSPEELHSIINEYASFCEKKGIHYYYLDLDDNAVGSGSGGVESTVALLQKINKAAQIKYLFILGNERVIQVAKWEDLTEDDQDVESDLCYTLLETGSPWESGTFRISKAIRVGRLPVYGGEDFGLFRSYFETVMAAAPHFETTKKFGLSALVWEDESNEEFSSFSKEEVEVSPEVSISNVKKYISPDINIFYFNLHGSNETEYWYGQKGRCFPEAVSPDLFNTSKKPYIVGVEACYGAKYTDGLTADDSILLKAMTHKCISFLGSSKIAYGTPTAPGCCADVIIGEFLRQISNGETAGNAFLQGMKKLVSAGKRLDDTEVKTLAEFNLYGDPSVSTEMQQIKSNSVSNIFSKIEIPMPDIRIPVRRSVAQVREEIERKIDDFAFQTYFTEYDLREKSGIRQKLYRLPDLGLNQKIFSQRLDHFQKIIKVYFDDTGKIKKVYESK